MKDVISGVFSRHATAYRNRLAHVVSRGEARGRARVLELLAVRPGEHVLDLGCGPGTLTVPLARAAGAAGLVLGADLARGMLDEARAVVPSWVRLARMDVERLGLRNGVFDAVAIGHVLQFCPDLPRALAEVRRVLREEGRLAASVPAPAGGRGQSAVLDQALSGLVPPAPRLPDADATRALLRAGESARSALQEAGFRDARVERVPEVSHYAGPDELVAHTLSWWEFAWRLEGLSEPRRAAVRAEALRTLRERLGDGPMELPGAAWVLSARR